MKNHWLLHWRPLPDPALRMICFPYAGGGASLYRPWAETLPDEVGLCAVQPPGRQSRFSEPAFTSLTSMLPSLMNALAPLLDRPYVTFGHSLGGLTSFELVRHLRANGLRLPDLMIVSGCRGPRVPSRDRHIHDLPTTEFRAAIKELNGTPGEVLENELLLELIEPALRADIAMSERYVYRHEPPLPMRLSVFYGTGDEAMTRADAEAWRQETTGAFVLRELPGDHFFIHSAEADLLRAVLRDITPLLYTRSDQPLDR
ncbi:thioesterase II family protein [Microtetraspora niveoalba]|uniref:thioesterase II family protein n=1 Tax=Microtetraspora niveoalba TaxID=46175 RepID=UPI000B02783D|nr:thioesterase [Microtetraspora niveoalba]